MSSAPTISRRTALRLLGSTAAVALASACAPPAPQPVPRPILLRRRPPQHPPQHHQPQHHKPRQQSRRQRHSSRPPRHHNQRSPLSPEAAARCARPSPPICRTSTHTSTPRPRTKISFWRSTASSSTTTIHRNRCSRKAGIYSDLRQIQFNLRKNVQWHTGRELTSEDVSGTCCGCAIPRVLRSGSATRATGLRRSRLQIRTLSF